MVFGCFGCIFYLKTVFWMFYSWNTKCCGTLANFLFMKEKSLHIERDPGIQGKDSSGP